MSLLNLIGSEARELALKLDEAVNVAESILGRMDIDLSHSVIFPNGGTDEHVELAQVADRTRTELFVTRGALQSVIDAQRALKRAVQR